MTQDATKPDPRPPVTDDPTGTDAAPQGAGRILRLSARVLLPLLIVALGAAGAAALVATKPKAKRRRLAETVTLVEVAPVRLATHRVVVRVMGTVTPAREVALQPQVAGRLVAVSSKLMPGARFRAGEMVVQIERSDYELAAAQRRGDVAQAEMTHKVELGRQEIAKREWKLHHNGEKADPLDLELALRKPQLLQTQAAVAAAKAALKQAELDLERTTVKAPFNAIVVRKQADLGSVVSSQTQLATLVGTDEYWVQASVPVDRLKWLTLPDREGAEGSRSHVRMTNDPPSQARTGYVSRMLSDLEAEGRMARVLVVVADPLGRQSQREGMSPLLLGAYVHVAIEGRELKDVAAIPRAALRGADRVWLMRDEGQLAIRKVELAWRDRAVVLVSRGLNSGDRLIVSDIASPVEGMVIRTAEQLAKERQGGQRPGPTPAAGARGGGKGRQKP